MSGVPYDRLVAAAHTICLSASGYLTLLTIRNTVLALALLGVTTIDRLWLRRTDAKKPLGKRGQTAIRSQL